MGEERALIFGAVCYADWSFLAAERDRRVICADGGIACAQAAGFTPDYYIGDGDSGGHGLEKNSVLLRPEKDVTDLQAAYELAREQGFTDLLLTGCTGGRQDHHLANLQLLERIYRDGVQAKICDPDNEITFFPAGRRTLAPEPFQYFSLIPIDAELRGVCIRGAKYPLEYRTVLRGDSLTVSNEWRDGPVELSVEQGSAWLIFSGRLR